MNSKPNVTVFTDASKIWEQSFEQVRVKVFVPVSDSLKDIINYGFVAPYLLVFEEELMNFEEAKVYAEESGLAAIAAQFGSSVVFVYPTAEGGWQQASENLFAEVISQSKISQYYEDGMAIMWDRFNKKWGERFIRGGVHRTCLYGKGAAADYIAKNCLKTLEGDGMFGKGDITPATCVLEQLSIVPDVQRRDIPIVSVGNSAEVNAALTAGTEHLLIKDTLDWAMDYKCFIRPFCRMVGNLQMDPDFEVMGTKVEASYCEVHTSADNRGDDKDTTTHKVGYVAYCNQRLLEEGTKLPLVLCFHGGGDSAMFMSAVSGWSMVAAKHNFLLVCIENHLNSTATEMMELLEHLRGKYNIDSEKIYATGFSMGGCKSWDMHQEYPKVFAAVAPMDATFEVGCNSYGEVSPAMNQGEILPVYYTGGEITPLPELPFQAQKCTDRMAYVLKINQVKKPYNVSYEKQEDWENPIWGIDGDVVCKIEDPTRGSVLTLHLFESENGCCYSVFGSISGQGHEVRHHTCEHAWLFLNQFRRCADGSLEGGAFRDVAEMYR